MQNSPRLIAIDGPASAGKTTVARLVAESLRARDFQTVLCPGDPEFEAPGVVRRLVDLESDARRLGMAPRARLALACARLSQLVSEVIRPALASGRSVVVDGSPLSVLTAACHGDGLPRTETEEAVRHALDGCTFDRVVVLDVHPKTAGIRRTLKAVTQRHVRCFSTEARVASNAADRTRAGLIHLAAEGRHAVLHTERITPDACAKTIASWFEGEPIVSSEGEEVPYWHVPVEWGLGQALASMPTTMALYFGRGLACTRALRSEATPQAGELVAWALDRQDPLRDQLVVVSPDYALQGLIGRPLSPRDLRVRVLERAPAAAAWSLSFLGCERSDTLRRQVAMAEPGAVLASVIGRDDNVAWEFRRRLWEHADNSERAVSLMYCRGELAARFREGLLVDSPVHGLASLRGAEPNAADGWLWRYAETWPCSVLSALAGRDDLGAYRLREALFDTGDDVIHSLRGLTDSASWRLRERAVERWPAAVVRSLLGVPDSARRMALVVASQRAGAGDVHVLRSLQLLEEHRRLPSWARGTPFAGSW